MDDDAKFLTDVSRHQGKRCRTLGDQVFRKKSENFASTAKILPQAKIWKLNSDVHQDGALAHWDRHFSAALIMKSIDGV